jgi:hypothetical protein
LTLASSYRAAFITANGGTTAGAQSALISSFNAGTAYFNIHTSTFAGGEIRGFVQAVPWETDALPVIGSTVLFGLGVWGKRKLVQTKQK